MRPAPSREAEPVAPQGCSYRATAHRVAPARVGASGESRRTRRAASRPAARGGASLPDAGRARPAAGRRAATTAVSQAAARVAERRRQAGSAVSPRTATAYQAAPVAGSQRWVGRAVVSRAVGQEHWGRARANRSVEWARSGRPPASTASGRGGQGVGPNHPSAGWAGGRGRPGSTPRWGRVPAVNRRARDAAIARRTARPRRAGRVRRKRPGRRAGRRVHCSRHSPTDRSRSGRNPSGRRPPRWRCRGRCRPRDASAGRRPGSAGWPRGGSRTGTAPTGRCRCPPRRAAGCARPTWRRP
ncbi:hypothetical protein DFR69_104752 [Nocardia neocaledoniensis]|uniref:Uncharacterized protein n=1 Tax=Nocardia neocaledoniensis TaxID=236511 RepID=A0A317NNR6_9NOCA|nr:hypothetical protein DFR69_104752 [Nocardia neocaledoniensis]